MKTLVDGVQSGEAPSINLILVFSCPQQVHIPFSKPIRTQRSTLVRGGVAGFKRVTQNHSAVTSSKQLKFAEDNERKSLLR